MRRALMVAALLVLLSLGSAIAANFDVQAEDIASFRRDVTITAPVKTVDYFLRGDARPNQFSAGLLDRAPTGTDSVNSKGLDPRVKSFEEEDDQGRYYVWQTPVVDPNANPPYLLTIKSATVHVYQNGGTGDITAGLFACPANAPLFSGASSGCDLLMKNTGTGAGDIVTIQLPSLATTFSLPATERLRLKIVNDNDSGSFNVQWGYKSNRPSRVAVTPS